MLLGGCFGERICRAVSISDTSQQMRVDNESFSFDAVGAEVALGHVVETAVDVLASGEGPLTVLLFGNGARVALEGCKGWTGLLWRVAARALVGEGRRDARVTSAQQRNGHMTSANGHRQQGLSWLELHPDGRVHSVFGSQGRAPLSSAEELLLTINGAAVSYNHRACSVVSLHVGEATVTFCLVPDVLSLDVLEATEAALSGGTVATPKGTLSRALGLGPDDSGTRVVSLVCFSCHDGKCDTVCGPAAVCLFRRFVRRPLGGDGDPEGDDEAESQRTKLREAFAKEKAALERESQQMLEDARRREEEARRLLSESHERELQTQRLLQEAQEREQLAGRNAQDIAGMEQRWLREKAELQQAHQRELRAAAESWAAKEKSWSEERARLEAKMLADAQSFHDSASQQQRRLADQSSELELVRAELLKERSLSVLKNSGLLQQMEELRAELDRQTAAGAEREGQVRALQRAVGDAEKLQAALSDAQRTCQALTQDRDAAVQETVRVEQLAQEAARRHKDELQQADEAARAIVRRSHELDEALRQKTAECERLQASLAAGRQAMETLNTERQKERDFLRTRSDAFSDLEKELLDAKAAIQSERQEMMRVKMALQAAQGEGEALRRELREMERQARDSADAARAAMAEATVLQEAKKKCKQLQKKVDAQSEQIVELKRLLSAASDANLAMERQIEAMLR